jgi:hypothetical protein
MPRKKKANNTTTAATAARLAKRQKARGKNDVGDNKQSPSDSKDDRKGAKTRQWIATVYQPSIDENKLRAICDSYVCKKERGVTIADRELWDAKRTYEAGSIVRVKGNDDTDWKSLSVNNTGHPPPNQTWMQYFALEEEARDKWWKATHPDHFQLALHFKNQVRFDAVRGLFGGHACDVRACDESVNVPLYCLKAETTIGEPSVWGSYYTKLLFKHANKGPKKKNLDDRLTEDIALVEEKGLTAYAMERPAQFARWHKPVIATVQQRKMGNVKKRNVLVIVLTGTTSTGKTTWAYKMFGFNNVYPFKPPKDSQTLWFGGYNGEPVLLMDDYRGQVPFHTLLTWLRGFPTRIDLGVGMQGLAEWSVVVITSNDDYRDWHPQQDKRNLDALEARFHHVVFREEDRDVYFHEGPAPPEGKDEKVVEEVERKKPFGQCTYASWTQSRKPRRARSTKEFPALGNRLQFVHEWSHFQPPLPGLNWIVPRPVLCPHGKEPGECIDLQCAVEQARSMAEANPLFGVDSDCDMDDD